MTDIVLETEQDRIVEDRAIKRIMEYRGYCRSERFPKFSAVDFVVGTDEEHGEAIAFIDIKARKETPEQIKRYGGLILKHRKIEELVKVEELFKIPAFAVFPFENGFGDIYYARPVNLQHKKPHAPPPRRKFRNHPSDDEPVVYLDWDTEVILMIAKEK